MKRLLPFLCLIFALLANSSAEPLSDIPSNLVAEGIPPIPAELKTNVARYLALGGARFRGWNTERREMMVTTRTGEVTELYVVPEPMGKRTPLTTFSEPVTSGWFQPGNGNRLVFQSDKGGNEQFQFYALDAATKSVTLLTDGASRNTGAVWSHDGSLLAYTSTRRNGKDNDVFLVNPADPATTRSLITNSSAAWGVAEWSRDDSKLLLTQGVSDQQTNLWLADVKTGERKLITPKGEKVFYNRAQFAENDAAIYAATDDGSDFLTLTRLDVQTGARTPLTANIPWDVEDFQISRDGRTLAFVTNESGFSKLHLLDVATRKPLPVPKIPGDIITGLAWHEKRRELAFSLDSSQSPNDAYSLDVDSGNLSRWTTRTRAPVAAQKFAEPQLIPIKSFDGLGISALVYRPDPVKFPGKRPALVSIHGGPSSQSRPGFRGNANYYVNELGMVLVYPNVRGSLGYGRKFLALDNGFNREDAVKDIGTVLDWMRNDPGIDSSRIGVNGGSYGGYMTLACLVKFADAFRCGVESVGITNFVTFLENTSDYRRANRRAEYGDERKPEMRAFLEKISPANHAAEIKAPLFIIQGENDPRVPVTEARQMRDAIQKNGGSVWYLMASDEGHGFTKKKNMDFQFHATVLFLQEHLLK